MVKNRQFFVLAAKAVVIGTLSATAGETEKMIAPPEPAPSKLQFRLELGAAYREFGDVNFNTGWNSRLSHVPQLLPSNSSNTPFGPPTGFADRTYVDGFVFRDINTEDPNSFLPGTTAFWSYLHNSQVHNGSLFFHGIGEVSAFSEESASRQHSRWTDGNNDSASPVVRLVLTYPITPSIDLGASLGFMFASISSEQTSSTFEALQAYQKFSLLVIDRYDLNGLIPPLAPYTGVFNPPGPAPLINNVPSQRSQFSALIDSRSVSFSNKIHESFDLDLYTISLGPTLRGHWQRIEAAFSTGMAFNIADWQADYSERLIAMPSDSRDRTIRRWRNETNTTKFLPGFYLQADVGCKLTSRCSLTAFGRYDWTKTLSGGIGPSSFSSNLDGFTVGGSLNFTF